MILVAATNLSHGWDCRGIDGVDATSVSGTLFERAEWHIAMSRWQRTLPDGIVQHVVNRGCKRGLLFHEPADCEGFLELIAEAESRCPVRLIAFSLMRNHWHLVVWPEHGEAVSAHMQWLMNAHIRQYRGRHGGRGDGHIYQGRYRNCSVPTASDVWRVVRYVEANALRARFVTRAEAWPWCSLATTQTPSGRQLLSDGLIVRPPDWIETVNAAMPTEQLVAVRAATAQGTEFRTEPQDGGGPARRPVRRGRPRTWRRSVAATNYSQIRE